jgi:hypothetical protein
MIVAGKAPVPWVSEALGTGVGVEAGVGGGDPPVGLDSSPPAAQAARTALMKTVSEALNNLSMSLRRRLWPARFEDVLEAVDLIHLLAHLGETEASRKGQRRLVVR